ncbi:MAG: hypothetical protein SPI35_06020 [Porphyromonas sp.]|nr:hypothetical protein [Porphyromonas sp.]
MNSYPSLRSTEIALLIEVSRISLFAMYTCSPRFSANNVARTSGLVIIIAFLTSICYLCSFRFGCNRMDNHLIFICSPKTQRKCNTNVTNTQLKRH